jgi:hypothetical protein
MSIDRTVSLHLDFRSSQWPDNVEQVQALVQRAIDSFVTHITAT